MSAAVSTITRVEVEVVFEGGSITRVSPDPVHVPLGGEVVWKSSSRLPFSIVFADPFFEHAIRFGNATRGLVAMNVGKFKYSVVLESDPSVRLDPEIEVDPPPVRNGGGN